VDVQVVISFEAKGLDLPEDFLLGVLRKFGRIGDNVPASDTRFPTGVTKSPELVVSFEDVLSVVLA